MKTPSLLFLFLLSITTGFTQDQDKDRERILTEEKLKLQDRLIIRNGEVFKIQNQQQTKLQNQLSLKNGTVVYPDGSIQKRNRERIQLRDGACLSMNGKKYRNEDHYMNKVRIKERQMDRREGRQLERIQNGKAPMRSRGETMQNRGGKGRP